MRCYSCKTKEYHQQQQQQVNQITNAQTKNKARKPNHKYTNKKQNSQNLGKQIQPRCVKNGIVYNRVKKSME